MLLDYGSFSQHSGRHIGTPIVFCKQAGAQSVSDVIAHSFNAMTHQFMEDSPSGVPLTQSPRAPRNSWLLSLYDAPADASHISAQWCACCKQQSGKPLIAHTSGLHKQQTILSDTQHRHSSTPACPSASPLAQTGCAAPSNQLKTQPPLGASLCKGRPPTLFFVSWTNLLFS